MYIQLVTLCNWDVTLYDIGKKLKNPQKMVA